MPKLMPTIILDEPCARLHEEVAAFAPVFVFKATRGFLSLPRPAAVELSGALAAAGLAPPYLFVAASFGGFAALAYAVRYPETLVGVVLVDASHADQSATALAAIPPETPETPKVVTFKQHLQGFGPVWTEACATMAEIQSIGDIPLIVLAAGCPDMPEELSNDTRMALTQGWHALQRKHAALSTRGEMRIVPDAGHDLVMFAPGTIIAAIRELALQPAPVYAKR